MQSISSPFRALVIGSSGTVGAALATRLAQTAACTETVCLSRASDPEFDLADPARTLAAARRVAARGPFSIVLDATGVLTVDQRGPEKSLAALETSTLEQVMQINAFAPMLMLRELLPALALGRCIYGKLSARVGSISDNRLGGWYAYRASKAALNMLLQTAAIEIHRRRPEMVIAALQPGTVRSALSERFVAGRHDLTDAQESATGLLSALDQLAPAAGASFIDWRGQTIPW
jgi:NAD(P)-dependent dehydrogenase (short-subunit alcohol dehydrogenase family)